MIPLNRITFILEEFSAPSAGQQLLDRFLIGYNADGVFRSPRCEVVLVAPRSSALEPRIREHRLVLTPSLATGLRDCRAAVVVPRGHGLDPNPELIGDVLAALPSGARCFVYGMLAREPARARELVQRAAARGIVLLNSSATAHAFRLPDLEYAKTAVRKCLITSYGDDVEMEALEALRAVAGPRLAQARISRLERWIWKDVWSAVYSNEWRALFTAAVSRSNTMQGDPEKDGRTQDIAGMRLVEKLVGQPRAWLLSFDNALTAVLVDLTGAVKDLNFAVELDSGEVLSAQLYRPPLPMQDHFSSLAEEMERLFRVDRPPRPEGLTLYPELYSRLAPP